MLSTETKFNTLDERKFFLSRELEKYSFNALPAFSSLISIHDIVVKWNVFSREMSQTLSSRFPSSWSLDTSSSYDVEVNWLSPELLQLDDNLWEDIDPECRFKAVGENLSIIQRDFIAFERGNKVSLVCDYSIDDGFNNFLRYVLPKYMLNESKLLLHSSCVISETGYADICLGPSGAGKTTISSMAPTENVLGDDMNLVELIDGEWFVTPALVGQVFQSSSRIGRRYKVRSLNVLKQGKEHAIAQLNEKEAFLCLSGAVANLFWDQLSYSELEKANSLIHSILRTENFYELEFNLDGKVWKYVEQFQSEIR